MNNMKILVVDDNSSFLEMLTEFLTSSGYNVVACDSGSEALIQFEAFMPDFVLTDIVMPGFD
jgi:CheY-like chemotaxis protein